MSKLLEQYTSLKKNDKDTLYLIRVGIFYNILNEDADTISKALGLKIMDMGPNIYKCGFPYQQIQKYTKLLDEKNIKYQIIDNHYEREKIKNNEDYFKNIELKKIVDKILNINFDNITFKDSFDKLQEIQKDLKKIYKD